MTTENLKSKFVENFGTDTEQVQMFFSPGRVNLIGEHIDYNGGMVLPVAINLGTYGIVAQRNDRKVRLMSLNFEEMGILEFSLDSISYDAKMDWANYPMGVFYTLQNEGFAIAKGFDMLFYGDLPNGAGLSSSASIEVLTATILNQYETFGISPEKIALLCQKSENQFNGVNCGIMDQFSIANGMAEHAVLLNCDTLAYEHVPATLGSYRIVIVNTNKKRGLVDSAYNQRRKECEVALEMINEAAGGHQYNTLCDLTPTAFLNYSEIMPDNVYKRAYHAIAENDRTLQSKRALSAGDLIAFGECMYSSHESLKHQFEVSCFELDTVVEISRGQRGVIGARMTGAGFGGCAIALVHEAHVDEYKAVMTKLYEEKTGLQASIYIAQISGGTARVE